jgi:hypothetical protein
MFLLRAAIATTVPSEAGGGEKGREQNRTSRRALGCAWSARFGEYGKLEISLVFGDLAEEVRQRTTDSRRCVQELGNNVLFTSTC